MSITIATFNVNSIKARLPNVLVWLDTARPDIVLLQETKCLDEAFPAMEIEERGYNLAIHGQKTYNGVAILSKFPLDDVVRGLPESTGDTLKSLSNDGGSTELIEQDDFKMSPSSPDLQARYIEAVASIPGGALRVASVYVPNGQDVMSDKFPYKLKFLERLRAHWAERLTHHEMTVLGGDFNVAPTDLDVHDPAEFKDAVLCHPAERERLRALFHLGLYDAFRVMHPTTRQFSWWDYRAASYPRNAGLRIDHLLLSAPAADCLTRCEVDEAPRGQEKASDHTPVMCYLSTETLQPE